MQWEYLAISQVFRCPDNVMDFLCLLPLWFYWIYLSPLDLKLQATVASISVLIAKKRILFPPLCSYILGDASESLSLCGLALPVCSPMLVAFFHVGAMCAFVAFNMLDAPCSLQ